MGIDKINSKRIIVFIIAAILIVVFFLFVMDIRANNRENYLRNTAKAQEGQIENIYDEMWKVIHQEANVADEYKNAFKEIYPTLIAGRYSEGNGRLSQWIQEQNPEFDTSLYKEVMKKIEVLRHQFMLEQKLMLDIIREHDNLLTTAPSKWFLNNKAPIEYEIISSTRTKDVIKTRVDDDVDLFSSRNQK